MDRLKISIVEYINSRPYKYAIETFLNPLYFNVQIDTPATCASNLSLNKVDLGLIPVAELVSNNKLKRMTDYGICACKSVRTVVLVTNTHVDRLRIIYLDSHSRSSAMLIKILAKHHWNILPKFVESDVITRLSDKEVLQDGEGMLLIGDKVFSAEKTQSYKYTYDLAEEWFSMTGLPFVFAVWATNVELDVSCEGLLNESFRMVLANLHQLLPVDSAYTDDSDILDYWQKNIIFKLGDDEKKGLEKFREFIAMSFS
ncbi:MAG: menaquinone biosynthesis protein [Bacteroidales bacterium]